MPKVLYERDGRIARITLNRPDVLNAIDDDVPRELAAAVGARRRRRCRACHRAGGRGPGLLRGLRPHALRAKARRQPLHQDMPWDPCRTTPS